MTAPNDTAAHEATSPNLMRGAIWIAIGSLIAAALVCVIWVLIGSQNDIIGRAFLTILLLAAFAGAALLDTHLAPRRPSWYTLASMVAWVLALLAGAIKIWMPESRGFPYGGEGIARFLQFIAIVLILRGVLLHVRLYLRSHARYVTTFTRIIVIVTIVLVSALAVMLIIPLMATDLRFTDLYWRIVVSLTILGAVGTALVPLINALNAPKRPPVTGTVPPPPYTPPGQPQAQWPTYVDGVTPLPVMPDGSPDWNAYYTGFPTVQPAAVASAPTAAAEPPRPAFPTPVAPPPGDIPPPPPLPPLPPRSAKP